MSPIQQWQATRRLRLALQTLRDMVVSMGPLLLLGGGLLAALALAPFACAAALRIAME